MATLTSSKTIAFNGVNDIVIGSTTYEWNDLFLFGVDIWSQTGATATVNFSGNSWGAAVLRFSGNVKAVINDTGAAGDRYLESILLSNEGGNKVTLKATEVGQIRGSKGADTITTGAGYVETISLGSGNNTLTVGSGGARAVLSNADSDTIKTGSGEVDYISSGRGNDTITTGSAWVGTIETGRGQDKVTLGAGGADYIYLGRDADTLILKPLTDTEQTVIAIGGSNVSTSADKDSDTVDFSAFSKALFIELQGANTVDSGSGYFHIRGFENATGGTGADTIIGNGADNILKGGAGTDKLTGGAGADDLYGGTGADKFIFRSTSELGKSKTATDTIFDFSQSQKDKIDLSAIDANTKTSGDQAFSFIGNKAFSKKAGELRFEKTSADTYVYGDVNGDGKADFAIHIDPVLTLKAADFVL